VAWITSLAILAAALISVAQPRLYESQASLEIQGVLRDIDPAVLPGTDSSQTYVQTQAEMLQQDALINLVVKRLGLDRRQEFQGGPRLWDIFRPGTAPGPEQRAVEAVKKNLSIAPSRDSRIIRIACDARDPQLAADLVNTLAHTFIEQNIEARRQAAQQTYESLRLQLEDLRSKLLESEAEMDVYARKSGVAFGLNRQHRAEKNRQPLRDELTTTQPDESGKHVRYRTPDARPGTRGEDIGNAGARGYQTKLMLIALREQLADQESMLAPGSGKIVLVKGPISRLEAEFRGEIRRTRGRVQIRHRASSVRGRASAAFSARQSAAISGLAARLAHYYALKQDVDANRKFYEAMLQRVSDAKVASAISGSNIRMLGPAQPPARPYTPNLPLNLAIGTVGGLILAIGCVVFQEQSNSALRVPGEAGMFLTLPELGAIPKADNPAAAARRLPGSSHGKLRVERAALEQRYSGVSESFRATLASMLSAGRGGDDAHIFLVTSSRPSEGKTTVVSNLGIALAEISSKVLLIDGDMRRPQLHKVFDQANSWGLSDILREKNATEELPLDVLVKKTGVPRLHLLPSGTSSDNIFGLLCSGRMARLLARFRKEFDYVLVDAPPCLEFSDARIMGPYVEKLLLVVRANYTDRKTAQAAVQRLLLDGIPVLGVILNRWDPARSDIYGYAPYYSVDHEDLV
jgi:capsular exopolysaccharide synthesis family protein